ncbi:MULTISPECIES: FUSC family protein [Streptomyces]|uniref:FUSC family protein n=2 Tax=Streptomyces TaxID=1883 RepID=A0ABZ1K124_9ACTN|nr:FUSC family protein [Streptomyces sp. SNU607]
MDKPTARVWLSRILRFDPTGLNWPRAVLFLDIALVPLVVFWAIGHEHYLLSALFGPFFAWLDDPGGSLANRASHIAVFTLIGAEVTALGFGIGGYAWGWLVLAAFAITLVAGLAAAFGVRRFVNAMLLNVWFSLPSGSRPVSTITPASPATPGPRSSPGWAERPCGCRRRSPPASSTDAVTAGTVALAFGLDLSHGYWMPIAAMVAMKPDLEQSTLTAAQRVVGALIGAVTAALLLLIPASEHGLRLFLVERALEVVALVLFMHGVAIRFGNYALYCAAVAAGVLILVDLSQPTDRTAEGYRVLWTLCGVGGRATRHAARRPAGQAHRQSPGTTSLNARRTSPIEARPVVKGNDGDSIGGPLGPQQQLKAC